MAEVAGQELTLVNGQVAGAMGAAVLAAIGAGLYDGEAEAFAAMAGHGRRIEPSQAAVRTYDTLYGDYLTEYPTPAP
jgi:ribulose kinase